MRIILHKESLAKFMRDSQINFQMLRIISLHVDLIDTLRPVGVYRGGWGGFIRPTFQQKKKKRKEKKGGEKGERGKKEREREGEKKEKN